MASFGTASHPLAGVRTRRLLLGLTGVEVAKALGIKPTSYYRLEGGTRAIDFNRALTLGRILGDVDPRLLRHEPTREEIAKLTALRAKATVEAHGLVVPSPPSPARPAAGPSEPWTDEEFQAMVAQLEADDAGG